MKRCWNCDEVLTIENTDREHIIPNSCGGKLKPKWLLCKICNNKAFGAAFDTKLADQVGGIANLLMIKRERKEPPNIEGKLANGQEFYMKNDGTPVMVKPVIDVIKKDGSTQIKIVARSEREFKEILEGQKKKYPQLDIEEAIKKATRKNELLQEPIHFDATIGGVDVFRAIAKIAINYYMYKTGERKYILSALPFVNGHSNDSVVWMYYPDIDVNVPNTGTVNHIIHLTGNPDQKVLFCHVELFNIYSYLVLLDENYSGPEINDYYCFNVLDQTTTSSDEHSYLSRNEVLKIITKKVRFSVKNVENKVNYVLSIAKKRQDQTLVANLSEKIVKEVLGEYPEGTEVTEDMLTKLTDASMKIMKPYIERSITVRRSL